MDSVSPFSVSERLDDSILSDDVGVSSPGGLTGLDVFEPRNGEESLNFLKGSDWNRESLVLFGELS